MPTNLRSLKDRKGYSDQLVMFYEKRINDLVEQLKRGDITIGTWQIQMRVELRKMNAYQLIAGAGGDKSKVKSGDWLKLGTELQKQYRHLAQFGRDITSGKTTGGSINSRAAMYVRSTQAMFWKQVMPVPLPAYPRDGSTKCRTNCKCKWVIKYEYDPQDKKKVIAVLASWKLGNAEHCPECESRAEQWNPLRIPVGTDFQKIPTKKGDIVIIGMLPDKRLFKVLA